MNYVAGTVCPNLVTSAEIGNIVIHGICDGISCQSTKLQNCDHSILHLAQSMLRDMSFILDQYVQ